MTLLDQVKPASDFAQINWIKALLVGESKRGKTESAATLPLVEDKPILAIGLTPRTRATLAGHPNVSLIEFIEDEARVVKKGGINQFAVTPKAFDNLYNFLIELWELARSSKPWPYSGIILDDMTQTNHYAMNHVLSLKKSDGKDTEKNIGGGPAQLHYVPQMQYMYQLFNSFLIPLPCHIVVCGHLELREDRDTEIVKYFPRVYGNLRAEVGSWFNEVYECTTTIDRQTKKARYFWDTIGSGQKDILGSTMNKVGSIWTSPFEVDLSESPCGFAKLTDLVQNYRKTNGGKEVTRP